MSTDTWLSVTNWLYLVSLFAAAVASVALWRLSIASGEEKDRQLDHYKTEAADRIATANAKAEVAKGDAARANAEAARANEATAQLQVRANQLEKDAAEARGEQERLKVRSLELELQIQKIGPRVLSQNQINAIVNSIENESFKPLIRIDFSDDAETVGFAEAIGNAIQRGGSRVEAGNRILAGGGFGISVIDNTGVLQRALRAAGIVFTEVQQDNDEKKSILNIGRKPPV